MKHLQTEIIIDAAPQKVWEVLADFEQYPNWNPFVQEIEGEQVVGKGLTVKLGMGDNGMTMKPKVTEWDPGQRFAWLGSLLIPGIFDGNHYFQLEDVGNGQTKFIHGEYFKGIFRGLIMRFVGEQTQQGFVAMNRALKETVEAQ